MVLNKHYPYFDYVLKKLYLCIMKLPRKKYNRLGLNDKIALQLAKEFNLEDEYKRCRRMGMSIISALEEWDLLDFERIEKLK